MALRDKLLGAKKTFASKVIEIEGIGKVELRQPSVGDRGEINKRSDGGSNLAAFQAHSMIACCFDPENGKPVFTPADYDGIVSQPVGGWVDELSVAVTELMNVEPAKAAKDLSETASDSSPTS